MGVLTIATSGTLVRIEEVYFYRENCDEGGLKWTVKLVALYSKFRVLFCALYVRSVSVIDIISGKCCQSSVSERVMGVSSHESKHGVLFEGGRYLNAHPPTWGDFVKARLT
jgi:hypothetical protein